MYALHFVFGFITDDTLTANDSTDLLERKTTGS